MRAADKGPPPLPSPPHPPLLAQGQASEGLTPAHENSLHGFRKRFEESPMRLETSTMSDPSCGLHHRAALGEEGSPFISEREEKEQTTPERDRSGRREDEEQMTQSQDRLIGSISLHMELASKKREVSHLVDEMQRLQTSINSLNEISTSKISQLQDMVSEKDRVIKDLAEKLLRQQDYTDLKRELRLLKTLDMSGWQNWGSEQIEASSPTLDKSPSDAADTNGARLTPSSGDESPSEDTGTAPTPPGSGASETLDTAATEQLHRCLRLNVDRFSGEQLNTLSISRCVRELLSANNIGQRLFAKLVLGLSQGTVSELLSKPKPWDKLTEKGRDSYRKMHAWACDQHCVGLLKSMLPKKGREGSLKPEADERGVLSSDPQNAPLNPTEDNNNNNNNNGASMDQPKDLRHHLHHSAPHPPMYPDIINGQKGFCHYGPEFPPVMLAHIYQEELLKLIGKRMKENHADDQAKQAQDEIRQALAIYHRELTLLAAQGAHHTDASCHACPLHRRPDCGVPYCRDQPPCCLPHGPQQASHEHGGFFSSEAMKVLSPYSGASPLLPLPPEGQQTTTSEESSPLQRMQSITNSLLNQAATPSFSALPQRPMKAVLPPITQQQFDHYNNLNTEDIVKRVKEQLSQYSISQRLFGESVLGLSQGSVSDLLARPKPWHMLTQKGREPFIRMQMFLEDENAVHKLVASQYKIAPERLMRMGGYGGVALPPGANRFSPVASQEPTYPSHRAPPSKPSHPTSPQPPSTPESPSAPLTAHSPSGSAALPSSGNLKGSAPGRRGSRCLAPYVQPSVYEMAAVTTDLDTQIITARIKETLTVHNIGQKLFGEAVLGLSQGSVSELLSKPKPWHMLSIKGREPFIRMQLWLNDPTNVEKLQAIKTERREANKRRRNAMEPDGAPPLIPCSEQLQGMRSDIPLDPIFLYPPSAKKPRILFSEEQKEALKLAYNLDPYPSTAVMEFLSNELGLSVRTITNWFHNHRMRLKQQNQEPEVTSGYQETPASTFDPIRFRLLLGQRLAEMCKSQQAAFSSHHLMPCVSTAEVNPRSLCAPPTSMLGVGKMVDADNTLDLSMSSQRFPQQKGSDKEEDSDRRSSESLPSSSSHLPMSAVDLTADRSANIFHAIMRSASLESSKSTLDLSLSALRQSQDFPSTTSSSTEAATSRNPTPDSGVAAPHTSSPPHLHHAMGGPLDLNMNLSSRNSHSRQNSPVDLVRGEKRNLNAPPSGGSGSNRRKAAAPQWVDPGLDLSTESDICEFDDDDDDMNDNEDDIMMEPVPLTTNRVINGVCVRQTDFASSNENAIVRIEPTEMMLCHKNTENNVKSKLEREENIRRLERSLTEHEEQWDDISDEDDGEMNSRS